MLCELQCLAIFLIQFTLLPSGTFKGTITNGGKIDMDTLCDSSSCRDYEARRLGRNVRPRVLAGSLSIKVNILVCIYRRSL